MQMWVVPRLFGLLNRDELLRIQGTQFGLGLQSEQFTPAASEFNKKLRLTNIANLVSKLWWGIAPVLKSKFQRFGKV